MQDKQLTIAVGIGAGIAAYKVAHLVRLFRRAGHNVIAIPTKNSLNFVGIQTWQELSENSVHTEIFHGATDPGHIELSRIVDMIVVAPCTADLGAKIRAGLADDLLTAVILASEAPKVLVPAMHTGMWNNPATQDNFSQLKSRGFHVLDPAIGQLSSGDSGPGRMQEPEDIYTAVNTVLEATNHKNSMAKSTDLLVGKHVLITAGGTIEPIDPVRYLANRSSGYQGISLAKKAELLGANVTLLAANCSAPLPEESERLQIIHTLSAKDMEQEVLARLKDTDILIMAAAVADYRPEQVSDVKLKKENWGDFPTIQLSKNPDILREAVVNIDRPNLVVGFGAETGTNQEILEHGKNKAVSKGVDFLAVNAVGENLGFGNIENEIWILDRDGALVHRVQGTKDEVADGLLNFVVSFAR